MSLTTLDAQTQSAPRGGLHDTLSSSDLRCAARAATLGSFGRIAPRIDEYIFCSRQHDRDEEEADVNLVSQVSKA